MKYVEYIELPKEADCFVLEAYHMNKYMPIHNNPLKRFEE